MAECNFGNLSDKRAVIRDINQRCLDMVESICSGPTCPDAMNALLIEKMIKDSPKPGTHAFKYFAQALLEEYN